MQALHDGRIAGAGLDVFTEEPPPRDHPLFQFENVICTAHTAGIDLQARDDMALLAARTIAALYRGEWRFLSEHIETRSARFFRNIRRSAVENGGATSAFRFEGARWDWSAWVGLGGR